MYGAAHEEHDRVLKATFQRLRDKGLTLNKKCIFAKDHLEFFGYICSDQGILADSKKIEAILNLEAPTNPSEVTYVNVNNISVRSYVESSKEYFIRCI